MNREEEAPDRQESRGAFSSEPGRGPARPGQQQPRRDRDVVEGFEPPAVSQEGLRSEEVRLQGGISDAVVVVTNAKTIGAPARNHPLPPEANTVKVLCRDGVPSRSSETTEHSEAVARVPVCLVKELVEIVVDGPGAVVLRQPRRLSQAQPPPARLIIKRTV